MTSPKWTDVAGTGGVAFVQRFDSALRLNVHTHLLTLDGVYVHHGNSDTPELVFFTLPEPTAEQVADVARRSADRIKKVLQKHGRELDPELGEIDVAPTESGPEPDALSACYGAAAQGLDLLGQRAGRPSLRLVDPAQARPDERRRHDPGASP